MKETKEVYGIIYIIKNKVNNKIYVGQTSSKKGFKGRYPCGGEGIERVFKCHKRNRDNNRTYNEHLLRSIEKYGFDAFEVDEEFDVAYSKEELDKLEDMYIKVYDCMNSDNGYNNKEGGSHGKYSKESKEKMSENKKGENNPMYGKCLTEEHKRKLRESRKGVKLTKEHIEQLIKSKKGKPLSQEHRDKISKANTGENNGFYGKHHTEETRQKMSEAKKGENNPWYGKSISQEQKKKISEANKGKPKSQETKMKISEAKKGKKTYGENPRAKAVYCYEFNEIRLTAKEWAEELKLNRQNISACCTGRYKSTGGYHFRYATEEEIEKYKNNLKMKGE